jgi:hypothetical protein
MRLKYTVIALGLAVSSQFLVANNAQALSSTFTQWNFTQDPVTSPPDNSPAPTTGTGTASVLGMTNNYTYSTSPSVTGSVAYADIVLDTTTNVDVWRIRGANPGNGWSNSAPEYTQGAEFDTSTVGYTGIGLTYSFLVTTQGIADYQTQYTTDGTTWTNIGSVEVGKTTELTTVNIDLSGIASVNNDANFGVRIVSAFAPSTSTYENAAGATYNNNSGNTRISNVAFTGTPVPFDFDPAYGVALGLPLFMGIRIAKKKLA